MPVISLVVRNAKGETSIRVVEDADFNALDETVKSMSDESGILSAIPVFLNAEENVGADRRTFLRQMAGAFAAALVLPALSACGKRDGQTILLSDPGVKWAKATCRFCGVGCGVMVAVKDGRVVAVAGDEKNPVNKGLLCVKGYHVPAILYGSDRLKKPMIRAGDGFKEASWDEALNLVGSKLVETLKSRGPQSVGFYGSGQWTIQEGYAAQKFMRAGVRSNQLEANARLCMSSAVAGFQTSFGMDEPMGCYDDIEAGDVFVLWGNNMAEMHPVLFSRILERRRTAPHVKIVSMETRNTRTGQAADIHLLFNPQTDLAIANGIANLLIKNNKVDRAFVEKHCVFQRGKENIGYGLEDKFAFKDEGQSISFDEFAKYVSDYTPEKVEKLSGVPAKRLEELAGFYGDPSVGVVSLWVMGMNQHTRGTWINNLVNNIHLLTGKISKPGNNPFSLTGQSSACGTVREVGTLSHTLPSGRLIANPEHRREVEEVWGVPAGTIPDWPGYHTVELFRAVDRGEIGWLWIQTTNPMVTMPKLKRYFEALNGRKTFLVVSDVYPTPTTAVADVILPAALWVEKEGCFGNSERRTQHWAKMVDPPGDARSDLWQIVEVAKRAGFGHLYKYGEATPGAGLEEALFEEYRKLTLGHGKDVASYKELREARGMRWPVVNGRETRYRYREGLDPYVKKGEDVRFYGKKDTDGRAVIWARPYEPPPEIPDEQFPFWLCTGRVLEHWHSGSLTRRVPELFGAVPYAYVEIHPEDADRLGIQNGQNVRVRSRRGELVLPASIGQTARAVPPKGTLFVPFFDEDKLINRVTLDAFCPISKQPDYKKCAVALERA